MEKGGSCSCVGAADAGSTLGGLKHPAGKRRPRQQRSGFTAGESEVCRTPPHPATIMIKRDETGMPSGNWKWLRFYGKICVQMWRKSTKHDGRPRIRVPARPICLLSVAVPAEKNLDLLQVEGVEGCHWIKEGIRMR